MNGATPCLSSWISSWYVSVVDSGATGEHGSNQRALPAEKQGTLVEMMCSVTWSIISYRSFKDVMLCENFQGMKKKLQTRTSCKFCFWSKDDDYQPDHAPFEETENSLPCEPRVQDAVPTTAGTLKMLYILLTQ